MTKSKRRSRPQTAKPRNEAFNKAMQEKGRSSATEPHRPVTTYTRKPKHVKREEY